MSRLAKISSAVFISFLSLLAYKFWFSERVGLETVIPLPQKDEYRILCVGDSITFGYIQGLNKILARNKKGLKFNVINKAVGGASSSAILNSMGNNLEECKPDIVLIMMGANGGISYKRDMGKDGRAIMALDAAGDMKAARRIFREVTSFPVKYRLETENNYRKLKEMADGGNAKLVCIQYPVLNVGSLKEIFGDRKDILFVDNEKTFKDKLNSGQFKDYFHDMSCGYFGHCTQKGGMLMARNIANVLLTQFSYKGSRE